MINHSSLRYSTLLEHDELLKAMNFGIQAQTAAMAQLQMDIVELRTAQILAEAKVREVRQERAMPPDSPPPPLLWAPGGSDRTVEPHVLQANASAMFSSAALVEHLTPLVEAANLTLDDVGITVPSGTTVAARWTIVVKCDPRTAARRVAVVWHASGRQRLEESGRRERRGRTGVTQ